MRLVTLLFTLLSFTLTNAAVTTLSTRTLTTTQQFLDMTTNEGGIIAGRSMKFLIDQRTSTPGVYFMNMNYKVNGKTPDSAIYHYDFARAVLGISDSVATFNQRTYNVQNKRYVAGTIQQYNLASGMVYGIQLYPEDVAAETTILNIMKALIPKVTIPSAKLHFVSTAPQQSFNTVITQIRAIRSPYTNATTIDTILNGITFIPMQLGTAYGYLRIFPTDNSLLSPYDIPVFEELPLDLAVVAGCITKQYQDTNAHVNLKSKERGTPNMVLRDASPTHPTLQPWNNQPIKIVITQNSYEIFASTEAEVQAKNSRNNLPWVNVQWKSDRTLRTNVEMCPGTSAAPCIELGTAYGTKSANLGFLMNRNVLGRTEYTGSLSQQFGYNLVPDGFGIPIQFYHDFVNDPRNINLKTAINDLIQMEHNGTSTPTTRATQSAAVQKLFYKAYLDPTFLNTVINKIYSTLPGIYKVKIRSSANAEDLPQFDGAGLHDSFSANLNKTDNTDFSCKVVEGDDGVDTKLEVKPKTVQCAIKAVYASLWNVRAIAERSYARLNHTQVGMGIGVVAKYDTEAPVAANSVVISRVVGSNNIYGYSFSNQVGNNLVTNPTPGTQSENVMALFSDIAANTPVTFSVTRYATPNATEPQLTRTVYTTAQMKQLLKIVQKTENAYCRYKVGYYPSSCTYVTVDPKKPKAIDMEFKYLETGEWVAKQLREFGGGAPTGSVARVLEFSASEDDLQVPWVEEDNMMMEQGSTLSVSMVIGVTVGVSVAILLAVMLVIRQRAAYQATAKIAGITTHSSSPADVELNNNYVSNPALRV